MKEIRRNRYSSSSRGNNLDPRLRSATCICQRNTVWINFPVDRFTHLLPGWHYDGVSDPPMEVETAFCFEDDVVSRIQHLALRYDLGCFDSNALYDWEDIIAYLQNLLVKNSLKHVTFMGTEYINDDSPESSVIWERTLQRMQERFAVGVWNEQKRAGWKLPVTLTLSLHYPCNVHGNGTWTDAGYVKSTR